ncbi:MAG TPA: cyclic peptide export ABC transporter [Thermoanaerobaculia bacterium]|nr:cyclic peptide export ABC transporter [Thermoanaerobaculia bacterium]
MSDLLKVIGFVLGLARDMRYARLRLSLVIIAGLVSGAVNTGLIVLINRMVARPRSFAAVPGWTFAALCVGLPLLRFLSQAQLVSLTQKTVYHLRLRWCRLILSLPLQQQEQIGPERLLASLTGDVISITEALRTVPLVIMHLGVVFCCLVYLGTLSPLLLAALLGFLALGVITYQVPTSHALRHLKLARKEWDRLFQHFRALTEGRKELKMHQPRREALLSSRLAPTAANLKRHFTIGTTIFAAASGWGQILFYIVIGLLLFIVPGFRPLPAPVLISYSITLIFMMTPLEVILTSLPNIAAAAVAIQRIEELGISLTQEPGEPEARVLPHPVWHRLELAGVSHTYRGEAAGETFSLGPIDLIFEPGELVFLVGGNGSGKTTLAKVLLGIYAPEAGEVRLDGVCVTDETRDQYRQHFSVVFSDFFLFEGLLGLENVNLDEDALRYLRELQLDHKVRIEDGKFSTLDLSQGQRKRLALLTAYLEDRPVFLFDEWAADQDPMFKEVFYLHLLPQLQARGKTVLVISHDDHYYRIADRIIKLDAGKVELDRRSGERRAVARQLAWVGGE